ncbi:MAG: hypothetical protein JRI61_06590, partial [Deltaproteobacteria bacterium]|nr:hypothetical protein [Deltaproteobacteria bacterium]
MSDDKEKLDKSLDPANVDELCGDGLKAVLTAIGEANNLGGPSGRFCIWVHVWTIPGPWPTI